MNFRDIPKPAEPKQDTIKMAIAMQARQCGKSYTKQFFEKIKENTTLKIRLTDDKSTYGLQVAYQIIRKDLRSSQNIPKMYIDMMQDWLNNEIPNDFVELRKKFVKTGNIIALANFDKLNDCNINVDNITEVSAYSIAEVVIWSHEILKELEKNIDHNWIHKELSKIGHEKISKFNNIYRNGHCSIYISDCKLVIEHAKNEHQFKINNTNIHSIPIKFSSSNGFHIG